MDPPDVLGMEPGIARPTKLPNRSKSKFIHYFHLNLFYCPKLTVQGFLIGIIQIN